MIIRRFTEFFNQFQFYLSSKTQFTEKEKIDVFFRRFAYSAFAFVIVIIGFPVWWVTTTPYRAQLPHFDVDYVTDLKQRLLQFSPNKTQNDENNNVWNNLQLNSLYNVHLVFIYPQQTTNIKTFLNLSKLVENKLASFAKQVLVINGGVEINFSAEHLWDFSLNELINLKSNKINNQIKIAKLATALDRFILQPLGPEPLLKIAIFFEDDDQKENKQVLIKLLGNQEETTHSNGLAIASWGGICIYQLNTDISNLLNSIMGILFKQLSIPSINNNNNLLIILQKHRKRLTLYNLLQTLNSLNALNELASKIEDLIISDEVANYASNAKLYFIKSYNLLIKNGEIDSLSASKARYYAELANTHHSLLELLNFPSDQKYGIYIPLFLPLIVPVLQPVFLLVLFILTKFKDYWNKKKDDKEN